MKLAVVLSHPVQYYSPWFRWIAARTALRLRVFYLWDAGCRPRHDPGFGHTLVWDTDLLSGYEHEFVPNLSAHPSTNTFSGLRNPDLPARLTAFQPDAVLLFGYNYRTHLALIARRAAGLLRTPLLFRGDSHLLGGAPSRSPAAAAIKRLALRALYSRFAAFLAVGSANRDYFRHYGVPDKKIFDAPHCVNQEHFTVTPARLASAAALRARLGIAPDDRVILFAGKFTAKKRPDLLLAAFLQTAPAAGAHLILAGDGPLADTLRQHANDDPRVHFLPFANQSEMPAIYLAGDVFALPSQGRHETWGLAVNESMHLARPALVSDVVGCQRDLVIPGQTGWVFPADHPDALAATLRDILALPASELTRIGAAAQSRAARCSYAAATDGLLAVLASISNSNLKP
ncbi:glycosyltransferase family 4 protein [Geminisphaera colitermitum]|uniref:glycosyltransferase family 4 protein n=1 Tax=Geminisphaera colitermitum TaxID=1148786 RepID=UPI000158C545|nr:glycosyltransferase family 4 protein [Geminisphaera colitermitum]